MHFTGRDGGAYHSHPAQRRDALAHGRQVVEQAASAVFLPETLDFLDLVGNGSEEVVQLCLYIKQKSMGKLHLPATMLPP